MLEGEIEQLNLLKPAKVRERERERRRRRKEISTGRQTECDQTLKYGEAIFFPKVAPKVTTAVCT